jgi:hypothetical protein
MVQRGPGRPPKPAEAPSKASGSRRRKIVLKDMAGGLNNAADMTTLLNNEFGRVVNFDVDVNGGLVSRPPIVKVADAPDANPMRLVGYWTNAAGTIHGVVSSTGGTWVVNLETLVYTKISTIQASGSAQYRNRLYICSKTTSGGYWDGASFTALDTGALKMPKGEQIRLFKSRFWLISHETGSERGRVYFSRIDTLGPSPTTVDEWETALDFFDVSNGDGQWITRLQPGSNELFIFRNGSTYFFKYDLSPMSGRLELINASIGADNENCVDQYEFSYLVLSGGRLYRFVSYNYYPLNDQQKVRLLPETSTPLAVTSAVSVFGRRALVWYGRAMYCLDLDQGTWSTWESTTDAAVLQRRPKREDEITPDVAFGYTGSTDAAKNGLLRIQDFYDAVTSEEMVCEIQTKAFDWEQPDSWKRLWYWSADVLTARQVQGTMIPVQLDAVQTDWDELEVPVDGWDDLEDGTWDQPLSVSAIDDRTVEYPYGVPYRVNMTFPGTDQRYRRAMFEVRMTNDGTTATAPNRLVGLTIHTESKGRIPREVQ